jgi:carboxypeptidase Taq
MIFRNSRINNFHGGGMGDKLAELKQRLLEVNDLQMAGNLMSWDQSTYMPRGGAVARGRQLATLALLSFEKFTDPMVGRLLDELRPYEENLPYESDDASLIRITRREYERAVRVPTDFVSELSTHQSEAFELWIQARPEDNFNLVRPALEKTLELSRSFANFFSGYEHIADPLIDNEDYGMKVKTIKAIFTQLREALVPLVQKITEMEPVDDACIRSRFPEATQLAFSEAIIKTLGYDFNRGRQDKTFHPFTTKFSLGDVRITTRVREDFLGECLYSTIHEAGHAMYEQGIEMAYEGTPLANGTSAGVHESQSRLWENIVGRSYGFWEYFYPKLKDVFPDQLKGVELGTFYKAVNKVEKSLIRTDADEVTYNLHVMMRFDFELALLEGKLEVKDLPDAWRARFFEDFGVIVPNDQDGVLQDAHWYAGIVGGAFQGYTLGNILSSQFYSAALKANPEIPNDIRQGKFENLLGWLQNNVYRPGSKFTTSELVEHTTGESLTIEPYINYLTSKFKMIYGF